MRETVNHNCEFKIKEIDLKVTYKLDFLYSYLPGWPRL